MGQRIGDYKNTLTDMQRAGAEQKPIGPNAQGKIGLREPLKTPTGWTKFKAALSHVPLLGKLGSLRKARAEVESYPVRLQHYQVESRQIMAGFVTSLRQEFGDHIADMATHDLDQTGNTPLTGRSVKSVIASAEHAKKHMQTQNRLSLMRFMEAAIQGGVRVPGEKDMVGIMFERGFKMPENAGSWKDFLGEAEANWVEAYINSRVQEQPGFSTGRIPNSEFVKIAEEALDILKELQSSGLSKEQVQAALTSATKPDSGYKKLAADLRETAVLKTVVDPMLDRKDPKSAICQTAQKVAKEMGMPPLPDAVLKCISSNMTENIAFRFAEIRDSELKCKEDLPSMKASFKSAVDTKLETLIREHCQALDMIEKSTVLTGQQKAALRNIASQRRLDSVQVRAFETFAKEFKAGLPDMRSSIETRNAAAFKTFLSNVMDSYDKTMKEAVAHGEPNWENGSLTGGEEKGRLINELLQCALADLQPEESRKLFTELTSDNARSILTGFNRTQDIDLIQLPYLCKEMTKMCGKNAGMSPQEIDAGVERSQEDVPVKEMSPTATLLGLGPESQTRCVDSSSPNRAMVRKGFSGDKCRVKNAEEWLRFVNDGVFDSTTGVSKGFIADLGRGSFFVNGKMMSGPGMDPKTSLQTFIDTFKGKDGDMKLAKTVSSCFGQEGLKAPVASMMKEALGGTLLGYGHSDYEAWQSDDGSWNIRCTTQLIPENFSVTNPNGTMQRPTPLDGKGFMLASVTYRISAESIKQGNPQLQVADSRTYFGF